MGSIQIIFRETSVPLLSKMFPFDGQSWVPIIESEYNWDRDRERVLFKQKLLLISPCLFINLGFTIPNLRKLNPSLQHHILFWGAYIISLQVKEMRDLWRKEMRYTPLILVTVKGTLELTKGKKKFRNHLWTQLFWSEFIVLKLENSESSLGKMY